MASVRGPMGRASRDADHRPSPVSAGRGAGISRVPSPARRIPVRVLVSGVTARVARCLVALSLCAAGAAGCAGTSGAGTVTIVIPWDNHSAEYNAFQSVIGPWEQRTGVKV